MMSITSWMYTRSFTAARYRHMPRRSAKVSEQSVEGVGVVRDGAARHSVLDRPARKSALDSDAVLHIVATLEAAAVDDALRVIVVRSACDDFCTGADVVARNAGDGARPRTGSIQRRTAVEAHRLIELL